MRAPSNIIFEGHVEDQMPPDFKIWIAGGSNRYVEVVAIGSSDMGTLVARYEHFHDNQSLPPSGSPAGNLTIGGESISDEGDFSGDIAGMHFRFKYPRASPPWVSTDYTPTATNYRLYSMADPDSTANPPLGILLEWGTGNVLTRFTWFKMAIGTPNLAFNATAGFTGSVLTWKSSTSANPTQIAALINTSYHWWHVTQM